MRRLRVLLAAAASTSPVNHQRQNIIIACICCLCIVFVNLRHSCSRADCFRHVITARSSLPCHQRQAPSMSTTITYLYAFHNLQNPKHLRLQTRGLGGLMSSSGKFPHQFLSTYIELASFTQPHSSYLQASNPVISI